MHIELTEMLRCPQAHREEVRMLSTGEMSGRMVLSGLVGCPVCHREYPVTAGVIEFGEMEAPPARAAEAGAHPPDAETVQALLDLGGPGGIVVLVGSGARHAEGLAGLM